MENRSFDNDRTCTIEIAMHSKLEAWRSYAYIYFFIFQIIELMDQKVATKIEELQCALKIDTSVEGCELRLTKELKSLKTWRKFWHLLASIFLGGFAILALVALIADGETMFGFEIKKQYLSISILVVCISTMVKIVGDLQLRRERLKSLLLFMELNR